MRETDTHVYFWGSYLSNFAWAPFRSSIKVIRDGSILELSDHLFNTSEHYFMACKALRFADPKSFAKILEVRTGKEAKAIGRDVSNFDPKIWDQECDEYMFDACLNKFSWKDNAVMKYNLLDTKNKIIVEASPLDKIWGVGLHEDDDSILEEKNWLGQNRLGKVLMKVRTTLRDNNS